MAFLGAIFSALAQGLLSLFGLSSDRKLGRAEVENAELNAELKEKENEAKVMEKPERNKSDIISSLRNHEFTD